MSDITKEEFEELMEKDPYKNQSAYAQMDRRIQFGIYQQLQSLNEKISTFEPVKITQAQGASGIGATASVPAKKPTKKTVKG